jgi:hypothetical protein
MERSRLAHRSVRPTTALAAIAVLSLLAGLLASPLQASAKSPTGTAVSKPRKKTLHRGTNIAWRRWHRPPPSPTTTPVVGPGQPVGGGSSTTPPPTAPETPTTPSAPTPTTPEPPTAPTTPSTPSSPTGNLLLAATSIRSFWLNNSEPGAVTEVPDPAGSGQTVFKFTVGDTDKTQGSTPNPRGELITKSTITAGEEFWWSTKFFLPADFPAATPGWVNLMQLFGGQASGSPPFHLELENGILKWQRNATYNWDVPWQMPQIRNQWETVMVHERFASDGFVEMWINGNQVTFFGSGTYNPSHVAPTTRLEMATMDSSDNAGPNSLYLQQYRKKGMYPTLTTYEGPLLIGNTRASVGG